MNNSFHKDMIVQDVVRDHHGEARVFRRLGIDPNDTCTLAEAALKRGWSTNFLMTVLDKTAAMTEDAGHNFQAMLLDAIIGYIEEHHHVFLKSELPRLEQLFDKAIEAHRSSYGGMLGKLKTVFLSLKTNTEEHLAIEEEILFPRLRDIQRYTASKDSPASAIQEIEHEHESMEWALNEMRALTSGYTPPDDASDALRMLYEGLVGLGADFQKHTYLEEELLWPVQPPRQVPVDDTTVTAKGKEDIICPRTNQPCEEGSLAGCSKFWNCVSEAMKQRWAKTNDGRPGDG